MDENYVRLDASNSRAQKLCVQATDNAGNASAVTCSGTVKIDQTDPTQSFSIGSNVRGNNGWYKSLSVKVTARDNESGVKSAKYCTTTGTTCRPNISASLSGNTFEVPLSTSSSSRVVCATVTDQTGHTSDATCSSRYYVDTSDPTASIRSISSYQGSATIYATYSRDSGSGIKTYYYSKDGGKTWSSSSNKNFTFNGLSAGSYTFALKVEDTAGRVSSIDTYQRTIR